MAHDGMIDSIEIRNLGRVQRADRHSEVQDDTGTFGNKLRWTEGVRLCPYQNLSCRGGPWGKRARFSPMLCVKVPKSELPPKAGTGILAGTVHLIMSCYLSHRRKPWAEHASHQL